MLLSDTVTGAILTMTFIKNNQLETLPKEQRLILDATAVSVLMAKVGVISKGDILISIKENWDDIDNYLVREMGHEPLTQYSSFKRQDQIGEFVAEWFPVEEQLELVNHLDSFDHSKINIQVDDLDAILGDILAEWFVNKMTGNDSESSDSGEGESNRYVPTDESVPVFVIYMGD